MAKVWKILSEDPEDLVAELLKIRGLKTKDDIQQFWHPKIEDYKKQLTIPGVAVAVKRIEKAIETGEQIIIYGDYDVDGVCATAIMYHALASRQAKVLPYIPHREKEGYGLSKIGLEFARDTGATLLITVDCGIVAFEQTEYAKSLGMDVIITDHHVMLDKKPEVTAIVHSTAMCGSAVAWCLAKELISEKASLELLDFVGMGSICDMMPMIGVNRFFAKEGVKRLQKTDRVGLISLLQECGIDPTELSAYHVSHIIGPRLNAMGRMEHAIDSLRLLCTKNPKKARELAHLLCETNDAKKQLTTEAIDAARLIVNTDGFLVGKKILIVHSKDWIPGIIGLVAARLAEEYRLPAIAIAEGEFESKGSARTVNGLNIIETIRQCSDLLIDVGGHPQAAGFTIHSKNIDKFSKQLLAVVEKNKMEDSPELVVDAAIGIKKLTKKLCLQLMDFEPTGVANPKPILAVRNIQISDIKTVGAGKHLKFKADGIDSIAFGLGDLESILQNGQFIDLAFFLELNIWNGQEKLQLKVLDLKLN